MVSGERSSSDSSGSLLPRSLFGWCPRWWFYAVRPGVLARHAVGWSAGWVIRRSEEDMVEEDGEEDGGEEPEPGPTRRRRMRKADFRLAPQARRRRKGRKGGKRKRMGKEEGSDGQPAGEVKRSKLLSSDPKGSSSGLSPGVPMALNMASTPPPRTVPPPPTPPPRTPPPHVRQQRRKKSKSIRKTLLTKTGAEDYAIVRGFKDAVNKYYD